MLEKTRELALSVAHGLSEKRAKDAVLLDLEDLSVFAEGFVIAHGNSSIQLKAMADATQEVLEEQGVEIRHREGTEESGWILIDQGDLVIHLFTEETRRFYNLERLWADAPSERLEDM